MSLLLIDGKNTVARGHFGYRDLQNSEGEPIGGILGTVRMLLRMVREYPGHLAVVVWDGGHAEWRKNLHPGYKVRDTSLNDESKEAIAWQSAQLIRIFRALGVLNVRLNNVEADDIIATLAKANMAAGHDPIVFSTDKDFLQLVTGKCTLVRPSKGEWTTITASTLEAATGRLLKCPCPTYSAVTFARAIIGDPSDCIKGVHMSGPSAAKKAVKHAFDLDPGVISPLGDQERLHQFAEVHHLRAPWGNLLKRWDEYLLGLSLMSLWRGDLLVASEWDTVLKVLRHTPTRFDLSQAIALFDRYEFTEELSEWWRLNVSDFANRRSTWSDSLARWSAPENRDEHYYASPEG